MQNFVQGPGVSIGLGLGFMATMRTGPRELTYPINGRVNDQQDSICFLERELARQTFFFLH